MPSAGGHDTAYSRFMKDTTYRSIPAVGTGNPTPCPYFIKLEYAVNDTSWRSQPQRINEFAASAIERQNHPLLIRINLPQQTDSLSV